MTTNTLRIRKTKNSYAYDHTKVQKPSFNKNASVKTKTVEVDGSIINKVLLVFATIAILGLLLVVINFAFNSVYKYITTSDSFNIEEINVYGITRISKDEVISISNIDLDKNIFSYNLKEIENNLLTSPWVDNVAIKRSIPNKFEISITERVPKFWFLKENKLYYLDELGRIIAPVETDNFISLPLLDIAYEGEELLFDLKNFLTELQTIKLPYDIKEVAWVKLSAANGYELFFEKQGLNISIASENWKDNIKFLAYTLEDLTNRKELDKVREISAADSQVWIVEN